MTDQPFTCIIFKVCLSGFFGIDTFATKERFCSPQNIKEDVSKRYPNVRFKTFRVFYYDHGGERVSLRNPSDYDIFYELNIEKLYMETDNYPFITKKTCSICGQCKKNGVNGSSVRSRFKKLLML